MNERKQNIEETLQVVEQNEDLLVVEVPSEIRAGRLAAESDSKIVGHGCPSCSSDLA